MNRTVRLLMHSHHRALTVGLALSLVVATQPGHADTPSSLPTRLEIIWSTPITTRMTPGNTFGPSEGLVLDAGAVAPDGRAGVIAFLGSILGDQRPGRMLLLNAEKTGPDAAAPLELPVPNPSSPPSTWTWFVNKRKPSRNPVILSLALGAEGGTWLGGFSDSHDNYTGLNWDVHRDAYLAKLDGAGSLLWKRSYGEGGSLSIESIAPATTGGAVGVGRGLNRSSWLAKVGPDGTLLAERRFGNGKEATVVPLRDGQFLVAEFTTGGQTAIYRDDLLTWVLDEAGELHGPTWVREALNQAIGSYFGKVAASAVADGAYVASNWSYDVRPQAVEVARVGPDGTLLWRQTLPNTIGKDTRMIYFNTCNPALATLADGDALVACALNGQIQLYRLDRDTGAERAVRLPLPECQRDHPAALFLMARRDGTVLLGGSRPKNNVAGNCSWLGGWSCKPNDGRCTVFTPCPLNVSPAAAV